MINGPNLCIAVGPWTLYRGNLYDWVSEPRQAEPRLEAWLKTENERILANWRTTAVLTLLKCLNTTEPVQYENEYNMQN